MAALSQFLFGNILELGTQLGGAFAWFRYEEP